MNREAIFQRILFFCGLDLAITGLGFIGDPKSIYNTINELATVLPSAITWLGVLPLKIVIDNIKTFYGLSIENSMMIIGIGLVTSGALGILSLNHLATRRP